MFIRTKCMFFFLKVGLMASTTFLKVHVHFLFSNATCQINSNTLQYLYLGINTRSYHVDL